MVQSSILCESIEHEENEEQEERLNKLATFQLMVITHAMKCW